MKKRRTAKGFSLVELVIVIAILAILTAIGLQIFNGVQDNARRTTAEANARLLAGALNTFNTMMNDPDERWVAIPGTASIVPGAYIAGIAGGATNGVQWPQLNDTEIALATKNLRQAAGGGFIVASPSSIVIV